LLHRRLPRQDRSGNLIGQRLQLPIGSSVVRHKSETEGSVSGDNKAHEAPKRSFSKDLLHHPTYRPDIDGLRALAIIPVVIFHAFPTVLPGGFIGVDIFFVISGFLISSIIFKGLQRGSFTFSGFYANRIKRIFPALLLVLSASFVFGWFFLLPGEYAQLGKHIVGGAGYVENFVLRREAGYFDTRSFLKPLMHLWSLGIEEQFYLTYPFLLWAVWRLRCNLLALIVPLVLISFSLNVWQVRSDAASSFFLPQTRFWELWVGGILAYLDIFRQNVNRRLTGNWADLAAGGENTPRTAIVYNVLSIVGIVLIGMALLLVHESAFPGWWALLPVSGATLLILGGPAAWINRRILSTRIAVFVGLISYPLYLWHWPILSFARMIRGDELSRGARIAAVIFSFVLSWATWRFVESPIRFGRKIWIKTVALILISVLIGCIGYTIHYEDGFAGRFKNLPVDFGWAQPETPSTPECRKLVGSDKMGYCRSLGTGPPDVLLIGDSHAGSLYTGLAPAYAQRSRTLMNLGEAGCLPFYDTQTYTLGTQRTDCRPIVNRMLDFAASTPSVRTIILSTRGPMHMLGNNFGEDATGAAVVSWDGAPKNSSQADAFAAAFRNTVLRLSAAGKNVVVFVDWPELGFDPRSCLPRPVPLFSHVRPLCGVPRSQVDTRNRAYRQVIFDMKREFSRLRVFDPFPYLCDSTACYAMRAGHLLYRDDNHLSAAGSVYLAGEFFKEPPSLTQ
jgi:peptidoglycan/LPS O-acetylase OafA/YrhL